MKLKNLIIACTLLVSFSYIAIPSWAQQNSTELRPQILTVRSGDTFYSLLRRHGFKGNLTNTVVAQLNGMELWPLVPQGKFWKLKQGKAVTLKFFHPTEDKSLNLTRSGKNASAELREEKFRLQVIHRKGKVRGSIIASIMNVIPSRQVAYRFLDAYRFNYKLKKVLQRNAPFSLTVEKKYLGKYFIRYGEILKTQVKIKGKLDTRYFLRTDSGGSFVSVQDLQEDRPLYAPVNYVRVSSDFQRRRFHPIKRRRIAHLGIDFEAPTGTPLYTAGDGVVLRTGRNRAAGRYVVIQHKNKLESFYNHMSYVDKGIKKGVRVKNGQLIGAIGCTGYCTKPHLHFAVKKHGRYKNPADFLKTFSFNNSQQLTKKVIELRQVAKLGKSQ